MPKPTPIRRRSSVIRKALAIGAFVGASLTVAVVQLYMAKDSHAFLDFPSALLLIVSVPTLFICQVIGLELHVRPGTSRDIDIGFVGAMILVNSLLCMLAGWFVGWLVSRRRV